jgi:hypothetical protein
MANIAVRLTNTGTLLTNSTGNVVFNEIAQSTISITNSSVYVYMIDEVTGTSNGEAMQQFKSGVLKVSGVFDEVSGIS